MNLEGWVIKISLGTAFVGVTLIFAGKIVFIGWDYFVHGPGVQTLSHWLWEITKDAAGNLGHAIWKSIFGG